MSIETKFRVGGVGTDPKWCEAPSGNKRPRTTKALYRLHHPDRQSTRQQLASWLDPHRFQSCWLWTRHRYRDSDSAARIHGQQRESYANGRLCVCNHGCIRPEKGRNVNLLANSWPASRRLFIPNHKREVCTDFQKAAYNPEVEVHVPAHSRNRRSSCGNQRRSGRQWSVFCTPDPMDLYLRLRIPLPMRPYEITWPAPSPGTLSETARSQFPPGSNAAGEFRIRPKDFSISRLVRDIDLMDAIADLSASASS
jgi:hypothetical protein